MSTYYLLCVLALSIRTSVGREYAVAMVLPLNNTSGPSPEQYRTTLEASIADINGRRHVLADGFTFNMTTCIRKTLANSLLGSFAGLLECGVTTPVVAAVGPFYPRDVQVQAQVGENGDFPIVSSALSRMDVNDYLFESTTNFFSLYPNNLFGGIELLENGLLDEFEWTEVALVVSDTTSAKEAVQQFENFVTLSRKSIGQKVVIPLSDSSNDTEAQIKLELEKVRDSGLTVIVASLEPHKDVYSQVFYLASTLELLTPEIAWICLLIPDWLMELNNTVLSHMTGMIATQINVSTGQSDWAVGANVRQNVKLANTYDAAWAIALAIQQTLNNNISLERGPPDRVGFSRLKGGNELMDQLRQVEFQGIAGPVVMQKDGTKEPRFDVLNLVHNADHGFRLVQIGQWSKENKLKLTGETIHWYNGSLCRPVGKRDHCRHRLQVLVPHDYDPYVRFHVNRKENERFSGWAIDTFKFIGKGCVDDNYVFTLWDGTWDEMIAELRKQDTKFDMAIAPIILTKERLNGVIFTRNVRQLSIRALVLRSDVTTVGLWQFLDPFSWKVWLLCIGFFLFSALVIFLLERNRDTFPEGAPSLADSLFVSFSTLTYTQDQDSVLTTIGRAYIVVVCFVVLILTSCFTANLTVFLLKTQRSVPFDSVRQLQNEPVGVLQASGLDYFLTSGSTVFPHIILYTSADDAVEALRNGNITAFIDDAGVLSEYEAEDKDCNLAIVSDTWRQVNTGFAMKDTTLHRTFASHFDSRILVAWDEEFFDDLQQRYFTVSGSRCSNQDLGGDNRPLDMFNLGGIFIIFGGMTILCLLGNMVRWYLYKKGILSIDLEHERPGGHATAQLIRNTVSGASGIAGGIPPSVAGSKLSLHKDDFVRHSGLPAGHGGGIPASSYDSSAGHLSMTPLGRDVKRDTESVTGQNGISDILVRRPLPDIAK